MLMNCAVDDGYQRLTTQEDHDADKIEWIYDLRKTLFEVCKLPSTTNQEHIHASTLLKQLNLVLT